MRVAEIFSRKNRVRFPLHSKVYIQTAEIGLDNPEAMGSNPSAQPIDKNDKEVTVDKERKVDKIHRLKQWVKDELIDIRFNEFENTIKVIKEEGESNPDRSAYEFRFQFRVYTETHSYRISAIDRSEDEGYLGCTATMRKPLAGENGTRGNDLADGKFIRETWNRIKDDIIAYELVKLAPKIEPVEREKEPKESEEEEKELKE